MTELHSDAEFNAEFEEQMEITGQKVTQWLLDNPKQADKLRNLLNTDASIAKEAGRLMQQSPEIFWEQIVCATKLTADDLLDLKRRIEGTLHQMTLDHANSIRNLP